MGKMVAEAISFTDCNDTVYLNSSACILQKRSVWRQGRFVFAVQKPDSSQERARTCAPPATACRFVKCHISHLLSACKR
jgi:hypothetical protein